jgi:hypothetical protein
LVNRGVEKRRYAPEILFTAAVEIVARQSVRRWCGAQWRYFSANIDQGYGTAMPYRPFNIQGQTN